MVRYPMLLAEVVRRGVEALAADAGVGPDKIAACLDGPVGRAAEREFKERVAAAVGVADLFRLPEEIEAHKDWIEASGGSWRITNPSIVRDFDRT